MKFFVDANLPFKFALDLKNWGFDTLHTDDLPNREKTTDNELLILIQKYFDSIIQLFEIYDLIEVNNTEIIGHEKWIT
jgi:predicted nuclease of predicted toxin-antitoxin system